MRKTNIFALTIIAFFLILPASVLAFEVKTDTSIYIAEDEVISGNLYAVGSTITVDGKIEGDVICGGQSISINGIVEGDVICVGQTINLNGEILGNARVAGNTININNKISRGVQAFGTIITLGQKTDIGMDMFLVGAEGNIRGKINGDMHGAVNSIVIDGEIGKDVRMRLDNHIKKEKPLFEDDYKFLEVSDNAVINGNLYYTAGEKGVISSNAIISGEVGYSDSSVKQKKKNTFMYWAWGKLFSVFSALVVGLVVITVWREKIIKLTNQMLTKAGALSDIGRGIIILFLTPIIIILLLITLIGLPLAAILSAVWIIAIYVSKILAGIAVGRKILNKENKKKKNSLIWAMIIGVVVSWIIYSIPFFGWILSLVAIWWGLGGIWFILKTSK